MMDVDAASNGSWQPPRSSSSSDDPVYTSLWQSAQRQATAASHAASLYGDGELDGGGGADPSATPPFPGFVPTQFNIADPKPSVLPNGCEWTLLTPENTAEMRPVRAERILVPATLFKREAEYFSQWAMPVDHGSAKAYATAALVSGLFAGSAMGIPSGRHSDADEAEDADDGASTIGSSSNSARRRKKPKATAEVSRYVYTPASDRDDQWPMFQIGYEEIYDRSDSKVVFVGVWKFTYDALHSSSHLFSNVMLQSSAMMKSQGASSQTAAMRNSKFSSEFERRRKAGLSMADLNNDFESNVGMQYGRMDTTDKYKATLQTHGQGRMFVDDIHEHVSNPAGRKPLEGDQSLGYGGMHPLSPEFVFNAKRAESLAFGCVGLDGSDVDVHPRYLDPSSYWQGDDLGLFKLPGANASFWICTTVETRTIFDLRLPQALQNQEVPGKHLMALFVERFCGSGGGVGGAHPAPSCAAGATTHLGTPSLGSSSSSTTSLGPSSLSSSLSSSSSVCDESGEAGVLGVDRFDRRMYSKLRTLAKQINETELKESDAIKSMIRRYDDLGGKSTSSAISSAVSNSDATFEQGKNKNTFRIRVTKATDKVADESTRIYNRVVSPWVVEQTRALERRRSEYLQRDDADFASREWADIEDARIAFQRRLYHVKRDLTKYHLRCLYACFKSEQCLASIPNGYKSMVHALETQLEINQGTASLAFPVGRKGKQIVGHDRQVWHELMSWLGGIFSTDAMIEGRDRFIMDELYLQAFSVYAETRFVLIICSERGKGKSVRASRLAKLLPEGLTAWQAASSARAGMNGNMSPNNGCLMLFDEMTKDLTAPECDERMEFWKTIVVNGEYSLERTCSNTSADGSQGYVTCEIVTDHSSAFCICTNLGPCFTPGEREPSAGKYAMINRTISLFARTEAKENSSDTDFAKRLETPSVKQNVNDFRLFTSLVGFCKLATRRCPWLQPDLSFANLVWKQGDTMLHDEYGMPRPEPRRMNRRDDNCKTQTLMEAVARTFVYKQTAWHIEAGQPLRDAQGQLVAPVRGKPFRIDDLADCLRLAATPTRAVINDAWAKSLYYSVSTSPSGVNVMTSLCHMANMKIDQMFRRIPKNLAPSEVLSDDFLSQTLQGYMKGDGMTQSEIKALTKEMAESRRLRFLWRQLVCGTSVKKCNNVLEGVKSVLRTKGCADLTDKMIGALMPKFDDASVHYNHTDLLRWVIGYPIDLHDAFHMFKRDFHRLPYRRKQVADGASVSYDHAWLLIKPYDTAFVKEMKYSSLASQMQREHKTPAALFDYHEEGITDTLQLMESSEARRLCPEMPEFDDPQQQERAFCDKDENSVTEVTQHVYLRHSLKKPVKMIDVRSRFASDVNVDYLTKHTDALILHSELPALQPYSSTKISHCAPLRRMRNSGIELNTVVASDHIKMVVESSMRLAKIPGFQNHQERFGSNPGSKWECLATASHGESGESGGSGDSDGHVTTLPFSNDLCQIAWVLDLARRQFIPTLATEVENFNTYVQQNNLGGPIRLKDMPQQPFPFMGYNVAPNPRKPSYKVFELLSVSARVAPSAPQLEISTASDVGQIPDEELRHRAASSLGYMPSEEDLSEYKKSLVGGNYTHGVEGDLNSYSTWRAHVWASGVASGNVLQDAHHDSALRCLLDAETMLECRLLERRGLQADSEEAALDLSGLMGMTYSARLKGPSSSASNQTSGGTLGNSKRKTPPPPDPGGFGVQRGKARMIDVRNL